ncbi:MAG: glucose-6-phosphate isomerase [Bacteroidales bacterium]|nr:glucose-6-phosphate isomerase [Bacteroidales bacterium]
MKVKIDFSQADIPNYVEVKSVEKKSIQSLKILREGTGKGNDFLGWIDLPEQIQEADIEKINNVAERVRQNSEVFVVAGIGGSYLGARMVIESLKHNFDTLMERKNPTIVYAGNTMNEDYLADLMEVLDKKDYSLAVISKSGTTTETAVTFRILRNHLENKYGKQEAAKRIIAITDKEKGVLKTLADKEGYDTFVIPDNVGGRYSVLTPVGLIPIAVAGFDIKRIIEGAIEERKKTLFDDSNNNEAIKYVVARNILYNKGKSIELLVNYQPNLVFLSEWWKQLYGESEGKDFKGLFPASVSNTTDLHSMGQYIQEGKRLMFESVLHVKKSNKHLSIPKLKENDDKLDYLLGFSLTDINHKAEEGTRLAHLEGNVSQITIEVEEINEQTIGKLIYFFEICCGISGYVLDVNPFNQPGVENYKKKMFALLGKE